MSTQLDDFLGQIPLDQLAAQLGVSESEADQAVRQAAPALLAGMQANASDAGGAAALVDALGQHDGSLLDGLDLGSLDLGDGAKIVSHIFGSNEDQVVNQLSGANGLSSGMLVKLLPLLAPLIMAYLAKAFKGGGAAKTSTPAPAPSAPTASPGTGVPASSDRSFPSPSNPTSSAAPAQAPADDDAGAGGGLGGILGGGGIGDILGGLLGGGGSSASGGGIGDILGGLLGGGTK